MRLRHLLAVLALVCAQPAYAANTVDWVDAFSGKTYDATRQVTPGQCVSVRFTTSNETAESKLLYVGGLSVTVQSDGDADGDGAASADLFACGETVDACGPLNLIDTDSDGVADDNTLDGTPSKRGTLDAIAVAGWIYVDPDGSTIDSGETMEVTVCAIK